MNDEYGNEEDFIDYLEGDEILEDPDIDDEDREVLNDRILGIINVFQNI